MRLIFSETIGTLAHLQIHTRTSVLTLYTIYDIDRRKLLATYTRNGIVTYHAGATCKQ